MKQYKRGDEVFNYKLHRKGVVFCNPREGKNKLCVLLDGLTMPRYFNVDEFDKDYGKPPVPQEPPPPPPPPEPTPEPKPEAAKKKHLDTTRMEEDPEWAKKLGSPIKHPEHTGEKGDHIKSYIINWVDREGKFHVEKIAAKGIVAAITIFYFEHAEQERAIVSVICVL